MINCKKHILAFENNPEFQHLHLGCMTVEDVFQRKLKRTQQGQWKRDEHPSIIEGEYYEDAIRDKYVLGSRKDVKMELQGKSKELTHRLLNRYARLFEPVTKSATKYAHQIQLTNSTFV